MNKFKWIKYLPTKHNYDSEKVKSTDELLSFIMDIEFRNHFVKIPLYICIKIYKYLMLLLNSYYNYLHFIEFEIFTLVFYVK